MSRVALATLRAALARAPGVVRALAAREPPFAPDAPRARSVLVTGVGSSAAHARFLAVLLAEQAGVPARFVPLDAFPRAGDRRDTLVVFSQMLSPNARLALAAPEAWQRVVLVTAAATSRDPERREAAATLRRAGVLLLETAGADEFGTLLRVEGPLAGYCAAFTLAEAFGAAAPPERTRVPDAMARALEGVAESAAALAPRLAADELLLLASGSYREAADNLRLKFVEGLLRAVPPVSDPIELAHGPFQALFTRRTQLLAFTRPDALHERERLSRLRRMLDPERHALVTLEATLPGFLAIFEHEIQATALLLAALEHADVDPADWPGRGRDAPLYDLRPGPRPLAEQTWPELAAALTAGQRVAVLPLGATEQHGPHLPFATDRWIADALAERFCARVPEAVRLPALALGASSEHLAFPGTLSLAEETLAAVLGDLARSLARHGFETIFCFSAHGGNLGVLRAQRAALEAAAAPCRWIAFTDHDALNARLFAVAEASGVPAAAAGHHAGELEASIVAALRPAALRRDALAPGRLDVPADPQAIFYPDLRVHAPSGTLGDPRRAAAERAAPYLDAWVDVLLAAYEGEKKRHQTKGTVRP